MKIPYGGLSALILLASSMVACSVPSARTASAQTAGKPAPVTANRLTIETPEWWFRSGAETAAKARGKHAGNARNIILFLGDGMSLPTIAAARILEGQRNGAPGEEQRLAFEEFPYTALSRTYEVDAQTPESAGTMSAIMTGIKTRYSVVSVNQRAQRGDCLSARGNAALTALELASAAGLSTGIVTSTRITHATPAATYAHSPSRAWEFDATVPAAERAQGCIDIASQFVDSAGGRGIDVAFGGGRGGFLPTSATDPEYPQLHGKRADGRDLIAEWQRVPGSQFVWNAAQFAAIDPAKGGRILGLFEPDHLQYEHDRPNDGAGEPSLADMTRTAISVLKRNNEGFFLMVEGGRIDHGHHSGNAFRALDETIAFSDAVRAAVIATQGDDTLIIVTADHSHTMTFAGYPARGNPILGKVRGRNDDGSPAKELSRDGAGRSYTTLGYANGPGNVAASDLQTAGPKHFPHEPSRSDPAATERPNLDAVDTEDADYLQESILPLSSETHGGEDVAVYARGPGAEGVHGSIEQNVLFHLMIQASPAMRARLCALDQCADDNVPVTLPDVQRLQGQ